MREALACLGEEAAWVHRMLLLGPVHSPARRPSWGQRCGYSLGCTGGAPAGALALTCEKAVLESKVWL